MDLSATAMNPTRWRLGLLARSAVIFLLLGAETVLLSYVIQQTTGEASRSMTQLVVQEAQHWLFRFVIAYTVTFGILMYLRGPEKLSMIATESAGSSVRVSWLFTHVALLGLIAGLASILYGTEVGIPLWVRLLAWYGGGFAAVVALIAGMAPADAWLRALRHTTPVPLLALFPAAAALLVFHYSQRFWEPAANLTFELVQVLLRPVFPLLHVDPTTLTLSTEHFSVTVAKACSGLEGVGLMLVFCTGWLWYFRRDFRFPQAFLIVPAALLIVFIFNAIRIGALLSIGDAGYPRVAAVGFHSQAGWIAFNMSAFGVAIIARRTTWLNRLAGPSEQASTNPTAAYLVPLLAIIAAGMVAHALSSGFDVLYPLRLIAALAALWFFRKSYRDIDWRASWRGALVGGLVFLIWMAFAHVLLPVEAMPVPLAEMSPAERLAWIVCRVAATTLTVPLAEELAFRGYLLRRLVSTDFESVPWKSPSGFALALSSIAFGLTHGSLWLAGILTGLAYGQLLKRTGKLGECVLAHATTNALLTGCVLLADQWQLW